MNVNNIQKLIYIPMQRYIMKRGFSFANKQKMLSPIAVSERFACRSFSNKARNDEEVDNQPVKYSVSPAAKYRARSSLKDDEDRLWYEPYVILASLSVFLLYFLVLREENDLDEKIYMPLNQTFAEVEEKTLISLIENSNNAQEVADAQKRLDEIRNR